MCHNDESGEPSPQPGIDIRDIEIKLADGSRLPARLVVPEGRQRGRVVMATDIYGVNTFYKSVANRLAAEGIVALLPDIFFREGKLDRPTRDLAFERRFRLNDARALEDLRTGIDWVQNIDTVSSGPVGTLGFCLGGNLVLHLSTMGMELATVAYYAFPAGLSAPQAAEPPIRVVDRMSGPVLAFWGDQDEKVGMSNVQDFSRAVDHERVDYHQHIYSEAGHGFLADLDDPSASSHDAAKDSWKRVFGFYESYFSGQSQ